jgi:phage baseplate assembly protein W
MASKVYSFKSIGEDRASSTQRIAQQIKRPPISIKTPIRLSDSDEELFSMHYNIEESIADNLKNLILTNHGERLFDYNFGANLKELAFELGNEDTDSEAIVRIQSAVSRYLPYVSLNTFESVNLGITEDNLAKIAIRISYTIPAINSKEKIIEAIIYTVG